MDTEETRRHVKDLWGKQELMYLGPDEQVRGQAAVYARRRKRRAMESRRLDAYVTI